MSISDNWEKTEVVDFPLVGRIFDFEQTLLKRIMLTYHATCVIGINISSPFYLWHHFFASQNFGKSFSGIDSSFYTLFNQCIVSLSRLFPAIRAQNGLEY